MTFLGALILIVPPALALMAASGNDVFELKVAHVRTLRDEQGNLRIDAKGVSFQSSDGKTKIAILMRDLRSADVADPRALRFETYEVQRWKPIERRAYVFRAPMDAPVEELARFLASRVYRPVVGHYSESSYFRVPAFHRRTVSGSSGMLDIGEGSIQFLSEKPADSRTWLYRDIETIGRPDAFRFRVTTNRETYVLELKEALPEGVYQTAWSRVYELERR